MYIVYIYTDRSIKICRYIDVYRDMYTCVCFLVKPFWWLAQLPSGWSSIHFHRDWYTHWWPSAQELKEFRSPIVGEIYHSQYIEWDSQTQWNIYHSIVGSPGIYLPIFQEPRGMGWMTIPHILSFDRCTKGKHTLILLGMFLIIKLDI